MNNNNLAYFPRNRAIQYQPRRHTGLGAIGQQLPAIGGGSPFQFGYNPGYFRGELYEPEEIAELLDNAALSYDTRAYVVSGWANPYIAVEGYAVTTWQSGSDFGQEIYNTIKGAGYPIDYGSIQFRFEPYYPPGQTAPPPMVGTPYPNTGQQQQQTQTPLQPGKCAGKDFGDWLACQLGITSPIGGVAAGTVGALIGVGAITLLGVVLLKR
jgi:hypothetical protein